LDSALREPTHERATAANKHRGGRALAALTIAVTLTLGAWAFWLEQCRLVVREEHLDVPHWPPSLKGFRLALLSDLHIGSPYWGLERLEQLVTKVNEQHPQIVLLAGDYLINEVTFGRWVSPEEVAK
jgi:uncharacterized protein